MFKLFGYSALAFSALITAANAQENCDATLLKDTSHFTSSTLLSVSYHNVVQSQTSKDDSSNKSVEIPVKGVPVRGSFSDVSSFLSTFYQSTDTNFDLHTSEEVLLSTVPNNTVENYRTCVLGQGYHPIIARFKDINTDTVGVQILWRPTEADANTKYADITLLGGTLGNGKTSTRARLSLNGFTEFPVSRTSFRTLNVQIQAGSNSALISLSYIPRVEITWTSVKGTDIPSSAYGPASVVDTDITPSSKDGVKNLLDIQSLKAVSTPYDGCGYVDPTRIYMKVLPETATSFYAKGQAKAVQSGEHCGASISGSYQWLEWRPQFVIEGEHSVADWRKRKAQYIAQEMAFTAKK